MKKLSFLFVFLGLVHLPVSYTHLDVYKRQLLMRFEGENKCTITSASPNYTASGSGTFVKKGEKNSWGNKDRDALYLKYEITMAGMKVATTDTLVMRDRTVALETFSPVAK